MEESIKKKWDMGENAKESNTMIKKVNVTA